MILYYAQPSIYAQALRASNVTATNTNDSALAALAAEMDVLAPPSTPIYLGSLRYQIRVGRHPLYAYVSLNAAALLTCLAVFAFSVLVAQAKGLPKRRVIWYAARNAILPSVSGFSLAIGFVVSGALLTEIVFSYPGLGWIKIGRAHV